MKVRNGKHQWFVNEKVRQHIKNLKVNVNCFNVLQDKELEERTIESLLPKDSCEHAKRESNSADVKVKIVRIDELKELMQSYLM